MNRRKSISKIISILAAVIITITNIASFTTAAAAQTDVVPQLISPSGLLETNQPVFSWINIINSDIQLYDLKMFRPDGSATHNEFTPDQLSVEGENAFLKTGETFPAGYYSWSIRYSIDGVTFSQFGEPLSFKIPTVDEMPALEDQITPVPTEEILTEELNVSGNAPSVQDLAISDANTFFVSPDGNDANPGTESAPWATINNSANRLSAGQTLYVRNGIYNETVYVTVSGESGNPINIMAYPGETPVIDGNNYQLPSSDWSAMVKIEGNFINMSGFEVSYSNWSAVVVTGANNSISGFNVHNNMESGIVITGENAVVENSTIWMNALSNENAGATRGGWATGLSASRYGNNAILRNNVVYQNWGEGLSSYRANGTVIEGNTVFNNYSSNILILDSINVLVQRNFVYSTADSSVNSGSRVGIMMSDETYDPASSNIQVTNNIVFGNYKNFYWYQGSQSNGMNNVLIANNTFVNSRSDDNFSINNASHQDVRVLNNMIVQEDSLSIANINGSGITVANNLWSKTPGANLLINDSFVAEPMLAKSGSETEAAWYHLTAESSAINHGTNLSEVVVDFDQDSRSGTWDIGADEFQGQPVVTEATQVSTAIPSTEPTAVPTTAPTNIPTSMPTTAPTAIPATATPASINTVVPDDGIGGLNPSANLMNIALGKPAKQSSRKGTLPGVGAANLAVDGNTDGNFSHNSTTHTKKNLQAWWQVDLQSVQFISTIDVWNRTDCCSSRLSKFYVLVSDVPFNTSILKTARNKAGVSAYYIEGAAGRPTTINVNRTGRYVRVQLVGTNYLSLAEVQIWGPETTLTGEGTVLPPTATVTNPPVTTTKVPTATPVSPTTQPTTVLTATAVIPTATPVIPTTQPTIIPTQSTTVSGAYYVANTGSDSNPGTIDRPWKTLKYAASNVKAGYTLYIRGGVYKEVTSWSVDGTKDAPITIKNYPGEQVVIDGYDTIPANTGGTWMFMVWGDWYSISGLEVKRSFDEGAIGVKGVHVTIDNCYTHHNWGAGITIMGDYGTAQNNRVWYNGVSNEFGSRSRGGWPAALTCARYPSHCTLKGNTSWENWGEGISTFEAYYTIIEDNVSYNNLQNLYMSDTKYSVMQRNISYCTAGNIVDPYTTQNGILVGDEKQNPASSDNKIINNIVYGCDRNLAIGTNESTNNIIANNTFVNTDGETNILMYAGTCTNCQFINNLVLQEDSKTIGINSGTGWTFANNLWSKLPSTKLSGTNDLVVDPKLAKSGAYSSGEWYKLQSTSPAINKGKTIIQILEDFFGYSRVASLDIGALEYR